MRIKIRPPNPDFPSPSLVAEAEIEFGPGEALCGMRLVGFQVRRNEETGELYVVFPSRAFGAGGERVYFAYLRGTLTQTDKLKDAILAAYHERNKAPRP